MTCTAYYNDIVKVCDPQAVYSGCYGDPCGASVMTCTAPYLAVGLKPSTVFGCGHVYHTECIQQPQEALVGVPASSAVTEHSSYSRSVYNVLLSTLPLLPVNPLPSSQSNLQNMYCVICRPHGRRRGQRPQPPK